MMGRFYEFRLDDRIPKNHLLRRINAFVTAALADVHEQFDPYYSDDRIEAFFNSIGHFRTFGR